MTAPAPGTKEGLSDQLIQSSLFCYHYLFKKSYKSILEIISYVCYHSYTLDMRGIAIPVLY